MLRLDAVKKRLKVIAASIFKVHWKLRKLLVQGAGHSCADNHDQVIYYKNRLIYWNRQYLDVFTEYQTIKQRDDLRKVGFNAKLSELIIDHTDLKMACNELSHEINDGYEKIMHWTEQVERAVDIADDLEQETFMLK